EILLIVDLGAWALEEACRQVASEWGSAARDLRLSVNVSTKQFLHGNFLATLKGVLERTGMDPRLLTLEITESYLMENIDGILPLMQQLVDLGVGFSVDDFGTGYSSLSYLKHLPIRSLKIDRSFIKRLPQNNA